MIHRELRDQVTGLGETTVVELESVPLDEELKEQLRALGYIE
jgi:hypothetical protein